MTLPIAAMLALGLAVEELKPGDQLLLSLYNPRYCMIPPGRVDAEGTIRWAPLPPIQVQGLTLRQAEDRLKEHLRKEWKVFDPILELVRLRGRSFRP